MSNILLWSLVILGILGGVAAVILFFVAKKFKVEENPLIDEVESVLAGANCGGCGFAGCRNFAEACVKAGNTEGLACPVGGEPTMDQVKLILTPADEAAAATPAEGGEKKGFDPAIAAKIKALATPRAVFPMALKAING